LTEFGPSFKYLFHPCAHVSAQHAVQVKVRFSSKLCAITLAQYLQLIGSPYRTCPKETVLGSVLVMREPAVPVRSVVRACSVSALVLISAQRLSSVNPWNY